MLMPGDPRMRASDADRDRTAAYLREHLAAGRLTTEEFNERLDHVYASKTMGELDQVLSDLPGIDLYELPDASLRRRGSGPGRGQPKFVAERPAGGPPGQWRPALASWATVSIIAFAIWLAGGHLADPWFLWVVVPYGLLLLVRALGGPPRDGRRR
jgi:Domain of unknown function (DUF1707)